MVACVCFASFQPVTESIATGEFLPPVTILMASAQMQVGVFIVGPAMTSGVLEAYVYSTHYILRGTYVYRHPMTCSGRGWVVPVCCRWVRTINSYVRISSLNSLHESLTQMTKVLE